MRKQPSWYFFAWIVIPMLIPLAGFAQPEVKQLPLGAGPMQDKPHFQVQRGGENGLGIQLDLPFLNEQELQLSGRTYQLLGIPGGGWRGDDGQPAVPEITRLVAVPPGKAVRARVSAVQRRSFDGYRLWPHQPDRAEQMVIDTDAYEQPGMDAAADVEVGAPALLGNLRVVPVTFRPVHYDAVAERIEVAASMTVSLTFEGEDSRNNPTRPAGMVPESFLGIYQQSVLNFDKAEVEAGPGTYLVICQDNAAVIAGLDPLLQWRKRQGYNVILATTAEAGTDQWAVQSYIQSVYDTADPPLEFIVLAGDANGSYEIDTFRETVSGYLGEGDHYYTTLAGSDILPDAHVGRLSFQNVTQLQNIVSKIVNYESAPYLASDQVWFGRSSLTGDPGMSGMSCIHVNQWLKHQLLKLNYTEIDTIWTSPFASQMTADLNRGDTVAGYRGYYGTSSFSPSHAANLTNGEKLPFAVYITCDTGSFLQDTECLTEAFLRNPGGGAVASIGMCTIHTETRENNCIYQGIFDGVLNSGDFRVGPALSRGKLEMYNNYESSPLAYKAEVWAVWNNLIGDPATEIWTAQPKDLTVLHDASLPVGANALTVAVQGGGGVPIEGARVALYKEGEILVSGLSSNLGQVTLPLAAHTAGTLSVTVTKHNFIPYLGDLTLGSAATFVAYADAVLDDDSSGQSSGNGDGLLNPGETCELAVQVTNLGGVAATSVVGNLSLSDPYLTIIDGDEPFGDIDPGASAWSAGSYVFSVSDDTPDGYRLPLTLLATDGGEFWTSLIDLTVHSAACTVESYTWGGGGGTLDPGESGLLTFELRNTGSVAVTGAAATLSIESPWIVVLDSVGTYGAITVGGTGQNTTDPFQIAITGDCYQGYLATFEVTIDYAGGARETVIFQTTIGAASSDDPVGPDRYGYYAFDDTDTDYPYAPQYDWVEIDPVQGGSGTVVPLTDTSTGLDDTEAVSLPFTFVYYGQSYDTISICSNGWIAMGNTYLVHWYNKTIPSAGSPDAMIAAFWDDLRKGGGGVYTWFDAANDRFVVEWSGVESNATGATETFEVILYDPAVYGTDTGDGKIVCQYKTVNNSNQQGYATVGIQNQDRSDGVLYTYYNRYPAGAATLQDYRAIAFVPVSPIKPGYLEGDVTNASAGGLPVEGATVRILEAGRTAVSQSDGHYFGSAPPGSYTVIVEHASFRPDTAYAVSLVEDQTTQRDFELTDIAGPSILNTTVHSDTEDTIGPYVIETNITDYSGLAEQHFYYTSSAGSGPTELSLQLIDPGTGLYRALVPGQPIGAHVQYWITAEDLVGLPAADPPNMPWNVYTFSVSEAIDIFSDDMQSDQGWTVGDAGDDATTGIWERADPNGVWNSGTEVQPEDDATPDPGTMCYITGNDPPGSVQGVDDVDSGTTTLLSPWFDLSGQTEVAVSYRRWYTNDTGYSPGEDSWVVEVTDDDVSWHELENTNVSQRIWVLKNFLLSGTIDLTGTVRFRFVASDLGGGSIVEAGVDDFTLLGVPDVTDVQAPSVTVSAPNGGEVLLGGTTTITWDASDDIGVVQAVIVLSTDGGKTYEDTLATGFWGGSWEWDVPDVDEPTCRIKVICADASKKEGSDESDADFAISDMTGVDDRTPLRLSLSPNRPNPFNPRTEIRFTLPGPQSIKLSVYDLEGRLVCRLAEGMHVGGAHSVSWNGTDARGAQVASGLYFYRLQTPSRSLTGKMLLMK